MGWFAKPVQQAIERDASEKEREISLIASEIAMMPIQGMEWPNFIARHIVDLQGRIADLERKLEEK